VSLEKDAVITAVLCTTYLSNNWEECRVGRFLAARGVLQTTARHFKLGSNEWMDEAHRAHNCMGVPTPDGYVPCDMVTCFDSYGGWYNRVIDQALLKHDKFRFSRCTEGFKGRRADRLFGQAWVPGNRSVVVVEGIFDAAALWQHNLVGLGDEGARSVLWLGGGFASDRQLAELHDLNTSHITIALDHDFVGVTGARALYVTLAAQGRLPEALLLRKVSPSSKDWAEYLERDGGDLSWKSLTEQCNSSLGELIQESTRLRKRVTDEFENKSEEGQARELLRLIAHAARGTNPNRDRETHMNYDWNGEE